MEELNNFRQTRTEGQLQTLVMALKVCPVCDSLTRIEAEKCGMCNWQGQFTTDVNHVSESLATLLEKCPELLDTLAPKAAPSFLTRLREVLSTEIKIRKRLDMSA
jgi:hypothetical protein